MRQPGRFRPRRDLPRDATCARQLRAAPGRRRAARSPRPSVLRFRRPRAVRWRPVPDPHGRATRQVQSHPEPLNELTLPLRFGHQLLAARDGFGHAALRRGDRDLCVRSRHAIATSPVSGASATSRAAPGRPPFRRLGERLRSAHGDLGQAARTARSGGSLVRVVDCGHYMSRESTGIEPGQHVLVGYRHAGGSADLTRTRRRRAVHPPRVATNHGMLDELRDDDADRTGGQTVPASGPDRGIRRDGGRLAESSQQVKDLRVDRPNFEDGLRSACRRASCEPAEAGTRPRRPDRASGGLGRDPQRA